MGRSRRFSMNGKETVSSFCIQKCRRHWGVTVSGISWRALHWRMLASISSPWFLCAHLLRRTFDTIQNICHCSQRRNGHAYYEAKSFPLPPLLFEGNHKIANFVARGKLIPVECGDALHVQRVKGQEAMQEDIGLLDGEV